MNIKSFKLITGEEIIGDLIDVKEYGTIFTVERPFIVQIIPQAGGSMGVALIPWLATDPEGIVVLTNESLLVKVPIDPTKQFCDQYLQQTTSIQLA